MPYPAAGGIRFVLDQVAVRDPRAKNFAPETFMDTRFEDGRLRSSYLNSILYQRDTEQHDDRAEGGVDFQQ